VVAERWLALRCGWQLGAPVLVGVSLRCCAECSDACKIVSHSFVVNTTGFDSQLACLPSGGAGCACEDIMDASSVTGLDGGRHVCYVHASSLSEHQLKLIWMGVECEARCACMGLCSVAVTT
jgi:hypothetical protein